MGSRLGERAETLKNLLAKLGVETILVERGHEVIEKVIEQGYDAILLDYTLALIPPLELREILRHNPRTTNTPILLLDLYEECPRTSEKSSFIRSPLKHQEWISLLLPGRTGQEEILKVSIKDLPLLDLLQMLLQGTQSGVLEIQHLTEFGRIEIVPPALGEISWNGKFFGTKALSRCLRLSDGTLLFRKRTGIVPRYLEPGKILLEGVKDRDEYIKYRPSFPPNSIVRLKSPSHLPPLPDNFLQELLMIIEVEPRVDMILDQLLRPDGEILSLLHQLLEQDWISVRVRSEEHTLERLGSDPPALPVPPGMYLTVWVLGEDSKVSDSLFRDHRIASLLDFQTTVTNHGRFGGNQWVLKFPGEILVWLRFLSPRLAHPDWLTRRGWIVGGVILLFSDQEEEAETFERLARLLDERHIPLVWVLWAEREKEILWSEIFGEELSGKVIQTIDPVEGFLKALHFLLYEQTIPR